MIATMVPSRRAPMAAATVSLIVIQNAASTSYSANSSERPWSTQHTPSFGGGRRCPAPFIARRLGRRAGVRLRRVGRGVDLEPRWANVRLDSLLPGSVGDHLLDCSVHLVAQFGIAQLQANAVPLGRERLADNLQLACVLRLRG